MHKIIRIVPALMVAALLAAPAILTANENEKDKTSKTDTKLDEKDVKKLKDAEEVLQASVSAPDQGIPKNLLEKAECVGVFPGVKKAALVIGGEGGKGVFTCRTSGDGNKMSPPAFFKIGGPSIGWQAGVQEADLVLLIMNKEGMNKLLTDKFKIGADASAAAGPVGRSAEASTDILLQAGILSWSRSRGLFAGVSVDGMALTQDKDDNAELYGRPIEARDILMNPGSLQVPQVAKDFVRTTEQYVKRVG